MKHKTVEMIDFRTKRFEYKKVKKLNPDYDAISGKGRFCATHKLPRYDRCSL